jgi:hypothetical protein
VYVDWLSIYEISTRILSVVGVPIALIAVVLILKPLIGKLIARTTALSLSGLEVSFNEKLNSDEIKTLVEGPKEQLEKLRIYLETEQIKQLIGYHQNGVYQSKISFWFSIGAACVGFVIILIGVFSLFVGTAQTLTTSYVSIGSGAIVDAVAALFFTQSNQARRLMTEFLDKLRLDRQFNEALRLCNAIEDIKMKGELQVRLSLFFAGIRDTLEVNEAVVRPAGRARAGNRKREVEKHPADQAVLSSPPN